MGTSASRESGARGRATTILAASDSRVTPLPRTPRGGKGATLPASSSPRKANGAAIAYAIDQVESLRVSGGDDEEATAVHAHSRGDALALADIESSDELHGKRSTESKSHAIRNPLCATAAHARTWQRRGSSGEDIISRAAKAVASLPRTSSPDPPSRRSSALSSLAPTQPHTQPPQCSASHAPLSPRAGPTPQRRPSMPADEASLLPSTEPDGVQIDNGVALGGRAESSAAIDERSVVGSQLGGERHRDDQSQEVEFVDVPARTGSAQALSPSDGATAVISWQRGQLIGAGSFGKVFFGLNTGSGELMAVKQITYGEQSSSAQQTALALAREVRCLSALRHRNIVRYLGVERDDVQGVLSIFLEYCAGGSISSLLEKFGPFNEALAFTYLRMVLHGLSYLHLRRIVHRDIKGANVLVDSDGVCKLADFGASKMLQQDLMSDGCRSLRGTPYWMAPEVIKQTGHGMPADVWSVGCTLLEMLTAKPPWSHFSTQIAALFHIASASTPPPMPPGISTGAQDFILCCLNRDPRMRPPCSELLEHPFIATVGRHNRPFAQVVSREGGTLTRTQAVYGTDVFRRAELLAQARPQQVHALPSKGASQPPPSGSSTREARIYQVGPSSATPYVQRSEQHGSPQYAAAYRTQQLRERQQHHYSQNAQYPSRVFGPTEGQLHNREGDQRLIQRQHQHHDAYPSATSSSPHLSARCVPASSAYEPSRPVLPERCRCAMEDTCSSKCNYASELSLSSAGCMAAGHEAESRTSTYEKQRYDARQRESLSTPLPTGNVDGAQNIF